MDFSFTQDQETLRVHLKKLLDEVCPPAYAERCDNNATPPREAYQALAENGWFGLLLPAEYGGADGSAIDLAILLEETGRHFEELAMWLFRTLTYGGYAVMRNGTREQKENLLPRLARGELSFCFALTEPHSGSDAAALTTRAMAADGGYVITGQKVFTSGMDISDYCLLIARTSSGAKKQHGITNFLVDTRLPGIEVRKIETLGQRAIATTQVFFNEVKVPAAAVLGQVDNGWEAVDAYLWYERLCLSAARTGAATTAFDYALEYEIWTADRAVSGDIAQIGGHEDDARYLAHHGLPVCVADVRGESDPPGCGCAKALHRRDLQGGLRHGAPDSRRLRLLHGISAAAVLPRFAPGNHRRGNLGDSAEHHCAGARALKATAFG